MSERREACRAWPLICLMLWLVGCATPPARLPVDDDADLLRQTLRERRLDLQTRWQLEGRVAVRNGDDGGSGTLSLQRHADALQLSLRAPVSGQGWRLTIGPEGARLEGLQGGPREDSDADRLLRDAVGWDLPLAELQRWVRGQRGGRNARIEFDSERLPQSIQEAGWQIEYRGWDHRFDPPLPRRIEAWSGERRLRLVVRQWQVGPDE